MVRLPSQVPHGETTLLVDSHCHTGNFRGFITGDHPPTRLIAEWDKSGVDCGMMSVLDSHDMSRANDATIAANKAYPTRIYGYIYLNPTLTDQAIGELDRCRRHDCFRGVKLHPMNDVYYPFHKMFFPLYEKIERTGLPVLWHTGTPPYSNPLHIGYVAYKFPKMASIMAHFGLSDQSWECFPAADLAKNIYIDTTANPIIPVYNDWIEEFGAERMLWGSDYPFYSVEYERQKIAHLGRTDRERSLIAGDNARRLFGI